MEQQTFTNNRFVQTYMNQRCRSGNGMFGKGEAGSAKSEPLSPSSFIPLNVQMSEKNKTLLLKLDLQLDH